MLVSSGHDSSVLSGQDKGVIWTAVPKTKLSLFFFVSHFIESEILGFQQFNDITITFFNKFAF